VAALIHFAYHGEYDADKILLPPPYKGRGMLLHVRVVGLAQKYFIESLQLYASKKAFELMKEWDGASPIFAKTVYEIYTGTQDVAVGSALRKGAVEAAVDKALVLFGSGSRTVPARARFCLTRHQASWKTGQEP
jgi:hypothetical protein